MPSRVAMGGIASAPLAIGAVDLASLPLAAVLCAIGLLMTHRVYVNEDSFGC